eukprot:m.54335 g.54335  ORF g.54335 m.54335 type:complete len:227 (+) comp13242_c0_seq1:160-840(+)
MEWLFGRRKTPEEMLKENQRALNRAIRELEREKNKLERQEGTIIADLKKAAKANQIDSAKIMAKDLVRTRNHVKKMIKMKTQIQAVSLKIQMLKSTQTMAKAMKGVTKAMQRMNAAMNIPALQQIMMEFEKQSEIMDMKQEVMDDTIDDALADSDEEAETDAVVSQVLDELGLSLNGEMSAVPQGTKPQAVASATAHKPQAAAVGAATDPADMDLQARLDNLRRTD